MVKWHLSMSGEQKYRSQFLCDTNLDGLNECESTILRVIRGNSCNQCQNYNVRPIGYRNKCH